MTPADVPEFSYEVFMAGRRSHPRYGMGTPWQGAVRVLREVVVDMRGTDELVAVSHSPGVVDDEMFLDLIGEGQNVHVKVRVVDSQPVIVGGAVQYRLRLVLASPEPEVVPLPEQRVVPSPEQERVIEGACEPSAAAEPEFS